MILEFKRAYKLLAKISTFGKKQKGKSSSFGKENQAQYEEKHLAGVTLRPNGIFASNQTNMKKCVFCDSPVIDKQKTARFCSVLCRIRAYRARHGIREPFEKNKAENSPQNEYSECRSFTCCENGKFYSPVGQWGEVLICDSCGATWVRK